MSPKAIGHYQIMAKLGSSGNVVALLLILLLASGCSAPKVTDDAADIEPTALALVAAAETVIIVVTRADTENETETTPTATATPSLTPSLTPTTSATPTASSTPETTADQPHQLEVILASVNVRQGPGTVYTAIGFLQQGDRVEIIARSRGGDWYLVRLPDDQVAWIAGSVTRPVAAFENDEIPVAATIPPVPTATPTNTPLPTATPANTPLPTTTFTPSPPPTHTPATVAPTNTPTPMPTATATPTAEY
jgi:uncharacterized protein YraI